MIKKDKLVSNLGYALFETAIGICAIAWRGDDSRHEIVLSQLPEADASGTRARILRRLPGARESEPPAAIGEAIRGIAALLRGEKVDLSSIPLDMSQVPPFHRRVFEATRAIRPGATRTYAQIAGEIGEPEVGDLASRFSTLGEVRARMRDLQRAAGAQGGVVMEGRDIGTAVFPDAEFKFYLDADVKVRAERRFAELAAKGERISREEVLGQLVERDQRDRSRALAPLKRADDAIVIDATNLTVAQVVAAIKTRIEPKSSHARA